MLLLQNPGGLWALLLLGLSVVLLLPVSSNFHIREQIFLQPLDAALIRKTTIIQTM
ncbi:unnamed protein product [Tetraodon nigroviridis]|uniref:Chromosome 2 SCAF14997, whole genome shotgun sequence n=1 Tax=Tetraodon nigroviridis TaxID=99883 RepID=Q4RTN4_TETNG|nr:unnamed protein product [Tetraodon nigroviridis]